MCEGGGAAEVDGADAPVRAEKMEASSAAVCPDWSCPKGLWRGTALLVPPVAAAAKLGIGAGGGAADAAAAAAADEDGGNGCPLFRIACDWARKAGS